MNEKHSILYVDDEESNLRVFKSTFRREFNIYIANSAREGMMILENSNIDVVITDQRMPEITGVEFLKQIHERFPHIPPSRLILSGFSKDEEIDVAFEKYKLFKFVSKPWNADDLREVILKAIEIKENGK
ncbi:MAG TPA: response regulator [Tenuifilaceae bacterium]|nr:response regulator [Tenuifilaceae bacterium]HPE18388.1 response regulator [Tenuifilaceae bacterium]HPJ45905.1 response regulator [Tenuifilaceae bacterium]HPQ34520.1 response regulator [Tenuifilaceae bacterium]HRX68258.1 response regulator [Tenuifilaceae bacterium]